jgi:hypothetical protein
VNTPINLVEIFVFNVNSLLKSRGINHSLTNQANELIPACVQEHAAA